MSLEEIKESYSNLSSTVKLILTLIIGGGGSLIYLGVTYFNDSKASIDFVKDYKPYDDSEVKSLISKTNTELLTKNAALEQENARLRAEVSGAQSALVQASSQLARVQEKASEAAVSSTEAKTIALGTQRETQAMLSSIREEIKTTKEGLEARMKALQRATTNPLGN
jgi:cell division septum initiation protein DivIVA